MPLTSDDSICTHLERKGQMCIYSMKWIVTKVCKSLEHILHTLVSDYTWYILNIFRLLICKSGDCC